MKQCPSTPPWRFQSALLISLERETKWRVWRMHRRSRRLVRVQRRCALVHDTRRQARGYEGEAQDWRRGVVQRRMWQRDACKRSVSGRTKFDAHECIISFTNDVAFSSFAISVFKNARAWHAPVCPCLCPIFRANQRNTHTEIQDAPAKVFHHSTGELERMLAAKRGCEGNCGRS